MKKLLCLTLVMVMVLSALSGCGNSATTSPAPGTASGSTAPASKDDILKDKVELIMYLIGGKPAGADEVFAKLNELTMRDLNATLTINYLPWGDWRTKYPLILSSGEQVDLIFTADWAFYSEQVRKGGFAELDEMLQTIAPTLNESISAEGWQQTKVDGSTYMVPCNRNEYDVLAVLYRKDWGDKANAPAITDLDSFEKYCDAIKTSMPSILPFNAGKQELGYVDLIYNGLKKDMYIPIYMEDLNAYVKLDEYKDPNFKTSVDEYEPEFLEYCKTMRRWQEKGFWSKSVMANETSSLDSFENGNSAIALCNMESGNNLYKQTKKNFPEAEIGFYNVYEHKPTVKSLPLISNGMAIPRVSKNKERALMLLEKLHTDPEYNHLTTYGIEGRDYQVLADGTIGNVEGSTTAGGIGSAWGWSSYKLAFKHNDDMPEYTKNMEEYSKRTVYNPMISFSPVLDSVEAEFSAVTNVFAQYKTPLMWGMIADVDSGYNELTTKLKEAGYDVMLAEIEKQFKEYAATMP